MKNAKRLTLAAALAVLAMGAAQPSLGAETSFGGFHPPSGWMAPPIHPAGSALATRELSPGVYALISDKPPVDNGGFVVGERGVLVIDAQINGAMARQVQAAVRQVTDKPILYLVNTNAHGDHTFGNYAFPAETRIVAHRKTAEAMAHFEAEKAALLAAVNGDEAVFAGVELRLPDLTFEQTLTLDLGGRIVELHHFGRGNTPGDTVVYVPEARAAWTGNLILGEGTIPWAIEGDTRAYLQTVTRLAAQLDIATIVPGHAPVTTGAILGKYLAYLSEHIQTVRAALQAGQSLEQALAGQPLGEVYQPAADSPLAGVRPVMQGFHRWNVKKTYLELQAAAGS